MMFTDGRIKDGFFERNVFKGATKVQKGSEADIKTREETKEEPEINTLR